VCLDPDSWPSECGNSIFGLFLHQTTWILNSSSCGTKSASRHRAQWLSSQNFDKAAFLVMMIMTISHISRCQPSWKALGSLTMSWLRGKMCLTYNIPFLFLLLISTARCSRTSLLSRIHPVPSRGWQIYSNIWLYWSRESEGCQWVINGLSVGYLRVIRGLLVGYYWVISGLSVGYQWVRQFSKTV